MGRYESQRAIAARTISERRRARKRRGAPWLAWFARRVLALALTLAGLAALVWYAPSLRPAAPPAPVAVMPAPLKNLKSPMLAKLLPAAEPQPVRRAGAARRHAPPAIHAPAREEEFEVLSAPELDAISQAH